MRNIPFSEYFWKRNHDYYILIHEIIVEQLASEKNDQFSKRNPNKAHQRTVRPDSSAISRFSAYARIPDNNEDS